MSHPLIFSPVCSSTGHTLLFLFSRFRVNATTGKVYTNVSANFNTTLLDRETLDLYYVTFIATGIHSSLQKKHLNYCDFFPDGGGLRSAAQLQVRLSDVNDNAPVILLANNLEGWVSEGSADLDRPLVIEATDRDGPPLNNAVMFRYKYEQRALQMG